MIADIDNQTASVLFLTDSLSSSGLGHARRCLALGQELKVQSAKVEYFLIGGSDTDLFKASRVAYTELPNNCTAKELGRKLDPGNNTILVVDTYRISKSFIEALSQANPTLPILAFDDFGEKADWPILGVLNPGIGAEEITYPGRFALFSAIGPDYMPLTPDCRKVLPRQTFEALEGESFIENILLVMGASDPERQTSRLLRILTGMNKPFSIHVVAGPQYGSYDDLMVFSKSNEQINLYISPEHFYDLAASCDMAVTGAGLTVSEFLYLGVPVAALILADNQEPTATALEKKKIGVNIGRFDHVDDGHIARVLDHIVSNPERLKEMGERGKRVIDGNGASRLATHVLYVLNRFNGRAYTTADVANEYCAAFSNEQPHEKVLWGSREGMKNRYLLALALLENLNASTWLDVGSGTGDFLLAADENGLKPASFKGVDLSPELVEYSKKRCLALGIVHDFICQDFMEHISGEPFDLVTCIGVLQKCGVGLYKAVNRLAELVRPGGRLLISTKNLDWAAFNEPNCTPYPGHHWFKTAQLQKAFLDAGLIINAFQGFEPRTAKMLPVEDAHSVFVLATREVQP